MKEKQQASQEFEAAKQAGKTGVHRGADAWPGRSAGHGRALPGQCRAPGSPA